MRILITGTSGHLGEALVRSLRQSGHEVIGLDRIGSAYTDRIGSVTDRALLRQCMHGVDAVLHSATLHKPHVATHARQDFVDTNISGTLNLLEEAAAARVGAFVFTSTTSTFGHALTPPPGQPAAWITEDVACVPKNIYGVTKLAAENLCELFERNHGLACIVLRTSRFFPEADDAKATRDAFDDTNTKLNEFLYRRVDLADVVDAHVLAMEKAHSIGFARYIISATTPFTRTDLAALREDAPSALERRVPAYADVYARHGWRMFPSIDRVYDNTRARLELGWRPRWDFASALHALQNTGDFRSPLAQAIGSKRYHSEIFTEGPFPVE